MTGCCGRDKLVFTGFKLVVLFTICEMYIPKMFYKKYKIKSTFKICNVYSTLLICSNLHPSSHNAGMTVKKVLTYLTNQLYFYSMMFQFFPRIFKVHFHLKTKTMDSFTITCFHIKPLSCNATQCVSVNFYLSNAW